MSHSSVNVAEISGSNALQVVHEVYGKMRSHLSMWGGALVLLIIIVAIVISGKISDVVHAVQRTAPRGPGAGSVPPPQMQMDRYVHGRGHADFSRHHPASREGYGSPQTHEGDATMGHPVNHSAPHAQPYAPMGHVHHADSAPQVPPSPPMQQQEKFGPRAPAPGGIGCPV